MESKKKVIFIFTLPPPIHGSAVVNQYIKDSLLINEAFDCDYINLSTSRNIREIGKYSPIKIWRIFGALCLLFLKLATKRYDLCYLAITCHGIGFLKDAPFVMLCKLFRNKIVIHQHNKGMSNDVDRWPYKWLLPIVYKNTRVILLSWRLYPDIEKVVSRENVFICPNGIPEISYEYKNRHNDIPHLFFLSNLIESKGVLVLLDALKILRDKGFSFLCFFIGGETKEINRVRFEKEVENRNLQGNAMFEGRAYGTEKDKYFVSADIFVFPTFYHNECFPLVLLEAMQQRLPIVTTREGAIPDIVKDGENGFLCEKNNPKSLADCIEKLLVDETSRLNFGERGFVKYSKEYTIQTFEKRIIEILQIN